MRLSDASSLLSTLHSYLHDQPHLGERHRIWSAETTTLVLLAMLVPSQPAGYKRTITNVHEELGDELDWKRAPDAAGFARARHNLLRVDDLITLQRRIMDDELTREMSAAGRWKGYRVIAYDGSWWLLPSTPDLIKHYGQPTQGKTTAYQPQVLVSTLWDTGSLQPILWNDQPYDGSERSALVNMHEKLADDDIVVADRGLPSHDILVDMAMTKRLFVFRMIAKEMGAFHELVPFIRNRKIKDQTILISCSGADCTPAPAEFIRFVKRRNLDGTWSILATNLPESLATLEELFYLYGRRWSIELAYRDVKMRYRAENFHGTTVEFVRQEIAGVFLLLTLESMIDGAAHRQAQTGKRFSRAALGDRMRKILFTAWRVRRSKEALLSVCRGLEAVTSITIPSRPDRHFERICKSQYGRWRFDRSRKGLAGAVLPPVVSMVA
jgi:hypothetical protein